MIIKYEITGHPDKLKALARQVCGEQDINGLLILSCDEIGRAHV